MHKADLENIIHQFRDASIVVLLCGGSVRDMIHGAIPKDYDLIVMNDVQSDEVIDTMDGIGFGSMAICAGYDLNDNDARKQEIDYVIKGRLNGCAFDVIRLNKDYDTPQQVVADFDFSINQAWLDINHFGPPQLRTVSDYPSTWYNIPNRQLRPVTANRLSHIAGKYTEYKLELLNRSIY